MANKAVNWTRQRAPVTLDVIGTRLARAMSVGGIKIHGGVDDFDFVLLVMVFNILGWIDMIILFVDYWLDRVSLDSKL